MSYPHTSPAAGPSRTVLVHQGADTKETLAMRLLVDTASAVAVPGMPAHTGVGRFKFELRALAAVQLAGRCHRAV